MKFKKKFSHNGLFLTLIVLFSFLYLGGISLFQTSTINSDGSGTLKFTYSAPETDVKSNNNIIGNLPFTPELMKQYFTSENTVVKDPSVYKDKNNPNILVAVLSIDFKNINKLSAAKGFSDMNFLYSDNTNGVGKLFRWVIQPSQSKFIEKSAYTFTFECDSLSTGNGIVENKTITFYRDTKKTDFSKEVVMSATVYTNGKTKSKTEPGGEQKSCGLFGLEFPVLMLTGLVLFNKTKRKKSRNQ